MSESPPTAEELLDLAESELRDSASRTLARATWVRTFDAQSDRAATVVEVEYDPDVGTPAPARSHDGFDPELASRDSLDLPADVEWSAGISRTAYVTRAGLRAVESRSHVRISAHTPGGARLERAVTSDAAAAPCARDLLDTIDELTPAGGDTVDADPGDHAVVLGPGALAAVLDSVRGRLGPGGDLVRLRGQRAAAAVINLSESPRYPATIPRSLGPRGLPRMPAPLIQDGVVQGVAAHRPDHLVLVGGGAANLAALIAPIKQALFLPAIDDGVATGALLIEDGRLSRPVAPVRVQLDAIEVLAATRELTALQDVVPTPDRSPAEVGATVCPSLRAGRGLRVLGPA